MQAAFAGTGLGADAQRIVDHLEKNFGATTVELTETTGWRFPRLRRALEDLLDRGLLAMVDGGAGTGEWCLKQRYEEQYRAMYDDEPVYLEPEFYWDTSLRFARFRILQTLEVFRERELRHLHQMAWLPRPELTGKVVRALIRSGLIVQKGNLFMLAGRDCCGDVPV